MKTLVLSDLHLGPDTVAPIYAGGDQLPGLIASQLENTTRIVLNGDTFDLLLDDEPLELNSTRAATRLQACAESSDGSAILETLALLTKRGGEILIRPGNHDLELALPPVQDALLACFERAGGVAKQVQFAHDDEPTRFEDGRLRILVTHGENTDAFNRWTRAELGSGEFIYPPGSRLVKETLNPLKRRLRFIDLLKPDFQGAVLAALAVRPGHLKALISLSTFSILTSAVERSFAGSAFPGDGKHTSPFDAALSTARLDGEEGNTLLDILETGEAFGGNAPTSSVLQRARAKIGRAALRTFALAHRTIAGSEGEAFFDEMPSDAEWNEAVRLAEKYQVDLVVSGHTHARRFRAHDIVTYVNTGTWIALLRLPEHDASLDEWVAFLDELSNDPHLSSSGRVQVHGTLCVIDPEDSNCPVRLLGETTAAPRSWFRIVQ